MKDWVVLQGDCLSLLCQMPDNCIHTCVTSPPYFGLRDYGVDGQIGLEETPDAFVNKLVNVFREVRRVLREDGTLWLNLGDSYCNINGFARAKPEWQRKGRNDAPANTRTLDALHASGFKTKDLIGIPWRVAFALQQDGWYLRQDIIWHKPNPMPESVKDRCTKAHEYIFLLSKGPRYYFDAEAIKEPATSGPAGTVKSDQSRKMNATPLYQSNRGGRTQEPVKQGAMGIPADGMRNRRSVWTVTTKPYKGAHFATFPPDLIEPCVLAGCPVGGVVLDPFGGAGTTGLVAVKHGRKAILLELNPEYVKIATDRIDSADAKA